VLAATSYGIVECNGSVGQFLVTSFLSHPVLGIAAFTVQRRCLCCRKEGLYAISEKCYFIKFRHTFQKNYKSCYNESCHTCNECFCIPVDFFLEWFILKCIFPQKTFIW